MEDQEIKISLFLPFKIRNNQVLVYLQKRSESATRLPGYFGFFGGHSEGDENPEETLLREVKEEMNFVPSGYELLGHFKFCGCTKSAYILEVDNEFEKNIKVLEGDYGKYFNEEDALNELKLIDEDKTVLRALYELFSRL